MPCSTADCRQSRPAGRRPLCRQRRDRAVRRARAPRCESSIWSRALRPRSSGCAATRAGDRDRVTSVHHADLAAAPTDVDGTVDVVVSNPPYVPLDERDARRSGGPRPRSGRRAVGWRRTGSTSSGGSSSARTVLLRPGGTLVVEHSDRQGESVPRAVEAAGFTEVTDHHDLTGRPRFTIGTCGIGMSRVFDCRQADGARGRSGRGRCSRPPRRAGRAPDRHGVRRRRRCVSPCRRSTHCSRRRAGTGTHAGAGPRRLAERCSRRSSSRCRTPRRRCPKQFWPGALTLVVRHTAHLVWDLGESRGTVAVRMPANEIAQDLISRTGPLAVSSANRSGHPPATTMMDARLQLGAAVAVYLDGGPSGDSVASTIVDVTGERAAAAAGRRDRRRGAARGRPRPRRRGRSSPVADERTGF